MATGLVARGVAGSHACGAVVADSNQIMFTNERVQRLVIWGSGTTGELPGVSGGWDWDTRSIAATEPDAPLREIQKRMRQAEGVLAESMCQQDYLVVVDGPLNYVRSRDLPVVGYVKTHHRALLDPEHHKLIPSLQPSQRTSLFRLQDDRYSCYLRLTPASGLSGPWAGIVRLEIPQSAGLAAASRVADDVAATALEIEGAHASLYLGDAHAPDGGQWPLAYLNSYGFTIAAGSNEIQRNILGERVLGLAKSK